MFKASIITLYPDMFPGSLGISLAGNALEKGTWELKTTNLRDFGKGKHANVDDTPAGGGAGMILRADVLAEAIDATTHKEDTRPRLLMSPRGKPLTQKKIRELSKGNGVVIVCGRFEGVDERVIETRNLEEVSIGDYILSGGEPAATILLDAVVRLLPGVMGNETSGETESFENGLLEHPHYTRPAEFEGKPIPEVLTSGNHGKVDKWRYEKSVELTKTRRPDLLDCTDEVKAELISLEESLWVAETRYDDAYMDSILANDFTEFGKSGKRYERHDMFFGGYKSQKIDCRIPLPDIDVKMIGDKTFKITYTSKLNRADETEESNRCSIWRRKRNKGYELIFHQGTEIRNK